MMLIQKYDSGKGERGKESWKVGALWCYGREKKTPEYEQWLKLSKVPSSCSETLQETEIFMINFLSYCLSRCSTWMLILILLRKALVKQLSSLTAIGLHGG